MRTRLVAVVAAAVLAVTMTACSSGNDDSTDAGPSQVEQEADGGDSADDADDTDADDSADDADDADAADVDAEHFPDACAALENAVDSSSDYQLASDDDAKAALMHQSFDPTLEYLDEYDEDIQNVILRAYTIHDMPIDGQVVQPGGGVPGTMAFVFTDLSQSYEDTCS